MGEAEDRLDRVLGLGGPARRRVAVVAEAVPPMEPMGMLVRPDQRRGGADEDWRVRAGDLGGQQRVPRRLLDGDIAGDGRQRQDAHVRRGKRHQDGDGVVGGGVSVDEEVAHYFK